jgi:hypothetical protein
VADRARCENRRRFVLVECARLLSGGVCLAGVSCGSEGIAEHGEGPGLGGMGAQLPPEAGRLGEVPEGLVVAPLAGAEPAQFIEHLGAKAGPLDLRRPQVAGGGQQRLGFLRPSLVASELVDWTTHKRVSFKMFSIETTRTYREPSKPSDEHLTIEELLLKSVSRLAEEHKQRVLIVIDEVDRMKEKAGLAAFIKVASSSDLKFVLVGIAESVSDLLTDHRSLERVIMPVKVPRMPVYELGQIVHRAMMKLRENQIYMEFDASATAALAQKAAGFPWFVHLLGQEALLRAYRDDRSTVSSLHVVSAVRSLVENRFAQQFSDMYRRAVRDSRPREQVLRALALYADRNIPTAKVYRVVQRLGVSNPSSYVRHLCDATYGSVVSRPKSRDRGLLRFNDEMFKVYARIAPPLYANADEEVRRAWRKEA